MAISNFQSITPDAWNRMSAGYTQVNPSVNKTGTTDASLSAILYVSKTNNTSFVIALSSSAPEALALTQDQVISDQLDLTCTVSASNQGTVYYGFTESQGWTDSFNVGMDLTNTNKTKGTWTFTKGKSEDDDLSLDGISYNSLNRIDT